MKEKLSMDDLAGSLRSTIVGKR